MAKFKLKLLTSQFNTTGSTITYLEDTISEFQDQESVYKSNKFDIQNREYTYCYTFNEKFSLHKNGQKDLSFSMLKNIWLDSEQTINPFVSRVKNGSQLLLIDQYNNEYIFTVKDIKHKLYESNILYEYSCQDSFTYQHIRQANGYSIENNIESNDFIGAQTVDWWIVNKIQPECHISYEYVSLAEGVYMSKHGELKKYSTLNKLTDVEKIIKPIFIKEEYPELYEKIPFSISDANASSVLISIAEQLGLVLNYREHNKIDDNKQRSKYFVRYFWFEPEKNSKVSNLRYSPYSNIKDFGFTHSGNSLTTILNVESNTVAEEVVSLIPEVPQFFSALFTSNTWDKSLFNKGYFTSICQNEDFVCENGGSSSSQFRYSLTSDWKREKWVSKAEIKIKTEAENKDKLTPEDVIFTIQPCNFYTDDYLYIHICNLPDDVTFTLPEFYDKISFRNLTHESQFYINDRLYSPQTSQWDFVIKDLKNYAIHLHNQEDDSIKIYESQDSTDYIVESNENICNDTYSFIPDDLLGTDQIGCYIRIRFALPTDDPIIGDTHKVVLHFHRDATDEELQFAEIADKCPWLENKLVDFTYFLEQGILSKKEYAELLKTLNNNLRIINGKLLYYSKEYYRSIQEKTRQLADLNNVLDSLGAAFNADVVESFKTTGSITDITYFNQAYTTMQTKYWKTSERTTLLDYDNLLTEYINKYFKAQQRFLKNIYSFKKFFNQKLNWGISAKLYDNIFTLHPKYIGEQSKYPDGDGILITSLQDKDPDTGKVVKDYVRCRYFSFNEKPQFKKVDSNFNLYDVDTLKPKVRIFKSDHTSQAVVVDKIGYGDYKVNTINTGDLVRCSSLTGYASNQIYYQVAYIAPAGYTNWPDSFVFDDQTWYLKKNDGLNVWYISAKPTSYWGTINQPWPETITYNTNTLQKTYVELTWSAIVNEYLYKQFYNTPNLSWCTYNTNTEQPASTWWDDDIIKSTLDRFHSSVLGNSFLDSEWDSPLFTTLIKKINSIFLKQEVDEEEKDERVTFYKTHFPITHLTYTGPNYIKSTYDGINSYGDNNELEYQPANKNNETLTSYIKFLENKYVKEKTGLAEIKNPFDTSQYITNSIPVVNQENEADYYRRVPKGGAIGLVGTVAALSFIKTFAYGVTPTPPNYDLGTLQLWATAYNLWSRNTAWKQKGLNTENFKGETFAIDNLYRGYHDEDSIIYARTQTSYDEWFAIQTQRQKGKNEVSDVMIRNGSLTDSEIASGWKQWTDINLDGSWWIYYNTSNDFNDYFNFYSKIAFTYSSARKHTLSRGKKLTFTDGYLRAVHASEKINRNAKYRILSLNNSDGKPIIFKDSSISDFLDSNNCISKILYYFIYNNSSEVDLNDIRETTWMSLFGADNNFEFTISEQPNEQKVIIFQEENFKRERISTNAMWDGLQLKFNYRSSFYSGQDVYNKETGEAVNFLSAPDLVEGLYIHANGNSGFIPASETSIVWDATVDTATKFFEIGADGNPNRVYTIEQMKQLGNSSSKNVFYYIDNEVHEETTVNIPDFFTKNVYLHQETYVKEGDEWTLDAEPSETFIKEAIFNFPLEEGWLMSRSKNLVIVDENGQSYGRMVNWDREGETPISNISNGHFWSLYHTRIDLPILFEEAAAIESQLTEYWTQAYNASLYCEYFLPSSWQSSIDGDTNYFNKNIITYNTQKNQYVLSNKYIPDVSVFTNGITTRLPLYELQYTTKLESWSDASIKQTTNINTHQNARDVLNNHTPFILALDQLGETLDNFNVITYDSIHDVGKTTYYYVSNPSSGTKWCDMIQSHSSIPRIYSEYSGLYVMMYKILRRQFMSKPTSRYFLYKQEQQGIWNKLYRQYPNILLEDSYSNPDATTSQQLYLLADYAFKDKKEPERGYNISLINAFQNLEVRSNDSSKYKKFQGQEIKIGEGILIDTSEYYDDYDDIYKTLSQYMFITDISYNLRADSDIQLTVNSIKYQDKLIQRLVKLIK